MKVVADANELFSAVISKGRGWKAKTLDIFFSDDAKLSTPYRLLAELEKNRADIMSKSGFLHEEFDAFIGVLKLRVGFVPLEKFLDKLDEAKETSPHAKDIEYFALALSLNCGIWSNENVFKRQHKVKIYSTSELMKELKLE